MSVVNIFTYIITNITSFSYQTRCHTVLAIMSVSTFKTAIILYIYIYIVAVSKTEVHTDRDIHRPATSD